MIKIFVGVVFLTYSFHSLYAAEMVAVRKEEKKFGDWILLCEVDEMIGKKDCQIAAKFYNDLSVLKIQKVNKTTNQLFVIIPQIAEESFVKIRIDKNDLILSKKVDKKSFGLISFEDIDKNKILDQIFKGEKIFIRFTNSKLEEITVKIMLDGLKAAIRDYNLVN